MMAKPRDLEGTLPSPSEMDNYHKCPCYWWMKDRLWVKPVAEIMPFKFGRAIDECFNFLFTGRISLDEVMKKFATWVIHCPEYTHDADFDAFATGTRDALQAWITVYGKDKENIVHVQPKMPLCRGKVDYIVEMAPGLWRVRERKLLSPFADIDDEIAKYQLGWQPLAYATDVELTYGVTVECVEMEFLIRSMPDRKAGTRNYKAVPASVRREPIFVDDWKKTLWRSSAEWTNLCMRGLAETFAGAVIPFEEIPRHTRNCLQKLGSKVYECDYYKACKTNTAPQSMEEHFVQEEQT